MATIGKLIKQQDGSYKGEIVTLRMNSKLSMRPIEQKVERGPDFRVFSGFGECGAAFEQTAQETGQAYLSIKLDDPTFAAPIYIAAFPNKEASDNYDLTWKRQRQQD